MSTALSDDGDRCADCDGVPDLGLDCMFPGPIELIELPDPPVQFDPSEEDFHLPAVFVKLGDAQQRQIKLAAQEDQLPVFYSMFVQKVE